MSDRWITSVYENNPDTPFNQILLPGTHDSATANLSSSTLSKETGYDVSEKLRKLLRASLKIGFVKNILFKIAITQFPSNNNAFITNQALGGVRVFDLRIYLDVGNAIFQHGTVAWNTKVADAMRHFQQSFRNDPSRSKEVVVFRLSHLKGRQTQSDIQLMLGDIQDVFGNALKPRGPLNLPISEMMKTPVVVILDIGQLSGPLMHTFPWLHISSECYDDDWSGAKKVGMSTPNLTYYMTSRFTEPPKGFSGLRELQAHYQFEMPNVSELLKGKGFDLGAITARDGVNKTIIKALGTEAALQSKNLSVISFDFYTQDLSSEIVALNKKRLDIGTSTSTVVLPAAKIYARMAEAAYSDRAIPDIGGYQLDASRSNDRVKVYGRPNEVVFAVRGTRITDTNDLVADVGVFFDQLNKDPTYIGIKAQFKELVAHKLPGQRVVLVGHSLGGSICVELLLEMPESVDAVHVFNSGIGYKRFAQNIKETLKCYINSSSPECKLYAQLKQKLNVYITGKDPISMLNISTPGTVHYVPYTSGNWHSISNFTGAGLKRSRAAIEPPKKIYKSNKRAKR